MGKIHSFLLPHSDNNHRAKAIRPDFIIFYLALFLVFEFSLNVISRARPDILGFATNISVNSLFDLTNKKRTENGVLPVILNPVLSEAARQKGQDMIDKGYWAHTSPDGTTPWYWISKNGYSYLYAGENLARDFNDSDAVVNAWMASPSHRENLLNNKYRDIGFAVVNGKFQGYETTLVVQMFGTRQQSIAKVVEGGAKTEETRVRDTTVNTPLPTITKPSPTPKQTFIAFITPPEKNVLLAKTETSNTKPLINIFAVTKDFAVILSVFLMLVLALDAFIIYRKKIVRLAGHNIAHISLLLILLGALFVTTQGRIL